MRRRGAGVLILTVVAGCSRPSPEREARAVREVFPATDPEEPKEKACKVTLVASAVTPTPGCWVDEKVSNQTTTLTYACGGGPAVAPFGVDFVGTVGADGRVELAASTSFHWDDGCQWHSDQRIRGSLPGGPLTYAYKEKPTSGTRCAPARCVASAKVEVQPAR
jgi:hypothetical protein